MSLEGFKKKEYVLKLFIQKYDSQRLNYIAWSAKKSSNKVQSPPSGLSL